MSKRKRQHPHAHLVRLSEVVPATSPQPVAWPGVTDASLDPPDRIKFELAELASTQEPGNSKLKSFEEALAKGPLGRLPEIAHWAMEEFFWHGLPGDVWNPIEAFLTAAGERFPEPAQEQLRRWKEARIGLYEVGDITDGTMGLQEWDAATGAHIGPQVRAIALNIGGVKAYRRLRGQITLTYVAPWSLTENLFCAMGYGVTTKKREAAIYSVMLGLRKPDIARRPYPWMVDREAGNRHLRDWRLREWHGWLKERLTFPFQAWVRISERGDFAARPVLDLAPMTAEEARQLGIYLEVPAEAGDGMIIAGLTNIIPVEMDAPNWGPIAEYQAFRERVGPPPATIGQPAFLRLRSP